MVIRTMVLVLVFACPVQAGILGGAFISTDNPEEFLTPSLLPVPIGLAAAHEVVSSEDEIRFEMRGISFAWALYRAPGAVDDPFVDQGSFDILARLFSCEEPPLIPGLDLVRLLARDTLDPTTSYLVDVDAHRFSLTHAIGVLELSCASISYTGQLRGDAFSLDLFQRDQLTMGYYSGPWCLRGWKSCQATLSQLSVSFRPVSDNVTPPIPEPSTIAGLLLAGICFCRRV